MEYQYYTDQIQSQRESGNALELISTDLSNGTPVEPETHLQTQVADQTGAGLACADISRTPSLECVSVSNTVNISESGQEVANQAPFKGPNSYRASSTVCNAPSTTDADQRRQSYLLAFMACNLASKQASGDGDVLNSLRFRAKAESIFSEVMQARQRLGHITGRIDISSMRHPISAMSWTQLWAS